MTMPKKHEPCLLCGAELQGLKSPERAACAYCGKSEESAFACPEGHLVCETCRNSGAMKMIDAVSMTTASKDPVAIAELMISHRALPLLGCEHAFLAAGALMAALKNSPYGAGKVTDEDIREVFNRTAHQTGDGSCALTGVCGIVPAIGACFSLFLDSRLGSDREQKITMEAVTAVAQAITDLTGPSCCKASVRAALFVAVNIFAERFGITLPVSKTAVFCRHSSLYVQGCREERCPYYKAESKDIFADSIRLPMTACPS